MDGEVQVPDELKHLPKEAVTVAPMSDFIAKLEVLVEQEHVVIITNSESTARCAVALNMTLNSHYIIIIRRGVVDAADALKEFELYERQLIDANGEEHMLGDNLAIPSVYVTDSGRILCMTDALIYNETGDVTEVFYKNTSEKAGILLAEAYNWAAFTNTVNTYVPDSVEAGFHFLSRLLATCDKGIPETLLLFGETLCLVSVNAHPSDENIRMFVYRILFGADMTDDVTEHIINVLAEEDLPDYLLDVVDRAFISKEIVSLQLWNNVAKRYLLERKD